MKEIIRAVTLIAAAGALGGCWNGPYESPAAEYARRTDTITLGAGNAKDVNAATHVIDPWPRRVGNRRIPGNGERMVNAIGRYKGRSTGGPGGQQPGGQSTSPPSAGSAPPTGAATPSDTLPF
jgi:hypothetical protein